MMKRNLHRYAIAIPCILCLLSFSALAKEPESCSSIFSNVLNQLENIRSYDINIIYSESAVNEHSSSSINSKSQSRIMFLNPNRLYIDSVGSNRQQTDTKIQTQTLETYLTLDGKHLRCRSISILNGKATTNSWILDMSMNSPEDPFNGFNFGMGGLLASEDYIGSVRTMLKSWPYDYKKAEVTNDIITFAGTFNAERFTEVLMESGNMSKETAVWHAKALEKLQKTVSIRVDTTRNLVVGYTIHGTLGDHIVVRQCRYEDIRINHAIEPDTFTFKSLPKEEFTDITKDLHKLKGFAETLKETSNQNLDHIPKVQ